LKGVKSKVTLKPRILIWFVLSSVLASPIFATLNPICTGIVEQALEATDRLCDDTGTNEACYGHERLVAQAQPGYEFVFEAPGDKIGISTLRSLRMSPMDFETGQWGVAMMYVRPNLPQIRPDQNLTFLLFGDVEVENGILPPNYVTVSVEARMNVNVRREPSIEAFVEGTLAPHETAQARGRVEDSSWLFVELADGSTGWVYTPAMHADGDIRSLNVVEPWSADFGPMQAFYLQTGPDTGVTCAEMPQSGILIQTPDGVAEVSLWINEVKVRLGSTAFIRAERNRDMTITMLEGHSRVEAFGVEVEAVAGEQLTIPMNENLAPAAPPQQAAPIQQPVQNLPVENLERPIPTLVPTATRTPTLIPTATPTHTFTPLPTNTPTPTDTPTLVPPTDTLTPTDTPTLVPPTDTPTPTETPTPTDTLPFVPPPTTEPEATDEVIPIVRMTYSPTSEPVEPTPATPAEATIPAPTETPVGG
jgi:hypothetical protein